MFVNNQFGYSRARHMNICKKRLLSFCMGLLIIVNSGVANASEIKKDAIESEKGNTSVSSHTTSQNDIQGTSMIVHKNVHEIERFTTYGGELIKNVRVGWESYGKLNEDKSNAILITHYFTGSSHAAGKYHENDEEPGYWDAIIGPGKAIDTERFFVISVDSLVNISAYDDKVITTGPASINPDTGLPYGLRFPVVTMRDFVNVQKSVLESLGITSLYAVAGPSMGSMQAIEWAAAYPDWVPRLISVIGSAAADGWTSALLQQWTIPIKLDPNWNDGNYYHLPKDQHPNKGLTAALALITQSALAPEFFNSMNTQINASPNAHNEDEKQNTSLYNIRNNPPIVDWLMLRAAQRAEKMDANHLLYLVRANQLFLTGMKDNLAQGLKSIKAKTLFIPARQDLLLMPYHAELAAEMMKSQGSDVELIYLDGSLGHLEGLSGIAAHADTIRAFLAE
uniref:E22 family MetX-like putative esterase n=1 Tax=Ningiella ruwaisensis TaxID=2364274 RepID=UPI001F4FF72D|nr:homoserine O-acetyltransferase [Ningiella ruwaisensis]